MLRHRKSAASAEEFFGMVSGSAKMREFFERLRRAARTDAPLLIRGETGTGKELVARAAHELSPRRERPFRALNCATLTGDLLASELFGHVRGAFTGAVRDRTGVFALADGGTLFLDEVAEIPLEIQARLLRVVQEQRFVPVGGTEPVQVDVRLISATNKALRTEVEAHRFREDLMYRLRVVPLWLPTLADRTGDIELLLWHWIDEQNCLGSRQIDAIDEEAFQLCLAYDWPGNIRELRNVVLYAFAVGQGRVFTVDDLTPEIRGEAPPTRGAQSADQIERQRIVRALTQAGGRKGEAATILGVNRSTLWRKMKMLGL